MEMQVGHVRLLSSVMENRGGKRREYSLLFSFSGTIL